MSLMSSTDVRRLAMILSIQAEIDGMKAYNMAHPDNLGYFHINFDYCAEKLRQIACMTDDEFFLYLHKLKT